MIVCLDEYKAPGSIIGYTVSGADPSSFASGADPNGDYLQGTGNTPFGDGWKLGSGTNYYFIVDGSLISPAYSSVWVLAFFNSPNIYVAYEVTKSGPTIPSSGWFGGFFGSGAHPPSSVTPIYS